MKLTKQIFLSVFLLALLLVVPYILTNLFQSKADNSGNEIEDFQEHNPQAVREHIKAIVGSGSPIPGEKKVQSIPEVRGVYETTNLYKNTKDNMIEDGAAPDSISSPAGHYLEINPLSESSYPMPNMSSERLPIPNPMIETADNESLKLATAPEITVSLNKMSVDSFLGGPALYN
jgi:hypothetical protein